MEASDIKVLCVTGAGQMGSQIAMLGALAGIETRLHDIADEQLEAAVATNRKHIQRRVDKGKLATGDMEAAFDRLSITTDLAAAAAGADFVIEAVVASTAWLGACSSSRRNTERLISSFSTTASITRSTEGNPE